MILETIMKVLFFFERVIETDTGETISFVVNDLDQYMESGSPFKCLNDREFRNNRSKYEYYRIGNLRTEIDVLNGRAKIVQFESVYDCEKFESYGALSECFITNKNVELVYEGQRYKKYVEGYYFPGCSEAYDTSYDNSKFCGLENKMYANIILDAGGVNTRLGIKFALRVQFYSRQIGDDSDMRSYFDEIGVQVDDEGEVECESKCDSSQCVDTMQDDGAIMGGDQLSHE